MVVNLIVQIEFDEEATNEEDVADAVEGALQSSFSNGFATVNEVLIIQDDLELEEESETDMN